MIMCTRGVRVEEFIKREFCGQNIFKAKVRLKITQSLYRHRHSHTHTQYKRMCVLRESYLTLRSYTNKYDERLRKIFDPFSLKWRMVMVMMMRRRPKRKRMTRHKQKHPAKSSSQSIHVSLIQI